MVVYRNEQNDSNSLSDSYIQCIYEDRDRRLWVGTSNGLNRLDRATNHFFRYQHHETDKYSLSSNNVTSIIEDQAGRLWVATASGGLNLFDAKTGRFHPLRQEVRHQPHPQQEMSTLRDDRILCLYPDKNGALWIGTEIRPRPVPS